MTTITRKIGLSLGADTCWPLCYEDIVRELDLALPHGKDTLRFDVERVRIAPFDLEQPCPYDVIVDRLTHWYVPTREWIKKSILMDGLYVWNNPWSVQSNEKSTTYAAMLKLGLPIPKTWLVSPKSYDDKADLQTTLSRYANLFDLGAIGKEIGYPMFMKPFDGGGWVGVSKIDDEAALRAAYEQSGKAFMLLQKGVVPFDVFVRCIALGPQTHVIKYDPSQPLHKRYTTERDFMSDDDRKLLEDMTLTINAFFGWDFNSCEALLKDHVWHPIDYANPCPDSQVTSLHQHFPWLVKSYIRWSLYCAATKKKMRPSLDWEPFFAARDEKLDLRTQVARYAKIARERLEADRFEEWCDEHLAHLDEVAWNYFGTPRAKEAIRQKVEMLFPKHEWETFTDHFFAEIQTWRERDAAERAEKAKAKGPAVQQHSFLTPAPKPAVAEKAPSAIESSAPVTDKSAGKEPRPSNAGDKTPKPPKKPSKK